jgi:hypothetical protein
MSKDKLNPDSDEKWGFSSKTRANMGYGIAIAVTAYAIGRFRNDNQNGSYFSFQQLILI